MVSDKTFTDAGVGRLLFTFATIVLPANSSINLNCNFHVISTLKLKNDLPVVPSLTEEIHMVFSIKDNFLVLRSEISLEFLLKLRFGTRLMRRQKAAIL